MLSLPSFYYFQDFMSVEYHKLDGVKLSKEKVI